MHPVGCKGGVGTVADGITRCQTTALHNFSLVASSSHVAWPCSRCWSHMLRTDDRPSVRHPILHQFLEMTEHSGFDLICFHGHDCQIPIDECHAVYFFINSQRTGRSVDHLTGPGKLIYNSRINCAQLTQGSFWLLPEMCRGLILSSRLISCHGLECSWHSSEMVCDPGMHLLLHRLERILVTMTG